MSEVNKYNIDMLPADIKNSNILTAASKDKLTMFGELPFIEAGFEDEKLKNIIQYYSIDPAEMEKELHYYAQELLENDKIAEAWQILLAIN